MFLDFQDGYTLKALSLYSQMEAPAFSQNYNIYRRIAMDVVAMPGLSEEDEFSTWARLRNMLFQLVR